MPVNYVAVVPNLPIASGTAYTTSTTITDIQPGAAAGSGEVVSVPAYQFNIGSRWRVTAHGVMSPAAATTLIMGLYYGGTGGVTLGVTAAITPGALTTLPWTLEACIDIRAVGSGTNGQAYTQGEFRYAATTLTTVGVFLSNGAAPAVQGIDTTIAKTLSLGATWGTNNGSTIQCHQYWVESVQ